MSLQTGSSNFYWRLARRSQTLTTSRPDSSASPQASSGCGQARLHISRPSGGNGTVERSESPTTNLAGVGTADGRPDRKPNTTMTCPWQIPSRLDGTRRPWRQLDVSLLTYRFGWSCVSTAWLLVQFVPRSKPTINRQVRTAAHEADRLAVYIHTVCERPQSPTTHTKASPRCRYRR